MFGWINRLFAPVPPVPPASPGPPDPGAEARSGPGAGARLQPEARFVVTVDATRIVCRRPSGDEESVARADLEEVIIETNDTGPWGADVWWVLVGAAGRGGCAIPQGATGEKDLLETLQRLPGFDNQALIDAMCCTDNKRFLCWRR